MTGSRGLGLEKTWLGGLTIDRAHVLYSCWTLAKLLPSFIQMNAKFLQIALQEVQVACVCEQGLGSFYFCQVS